MSARSERALAIAVALLGLVPLGLVLVEAVSATLAPGLARAIHALLGPLCHQMAARCPDVHGHALGACWRCLGVDAGLLAAAIGPRRSWRVGAGLVTLGGLDWALAQAALSPDTALERLVLGAALGAGLAALGMAGARVLATRGRAAIRVALG